MKPMTTRVRLLAVCVLALPAVAFAAAPRTWGELVGLLVSFMNSGVTVLVALAIAIYFYGIASNILEFGGGHSQEKLKNYFYWGIIVLFVMVSVWGILRLMQNTIFGAGASTASSGPGTSVQCLFNNC